MYFAGTDSHGIRQNGFAVAPSWTLHREAMTEDAPAMVKEHAREG
ncbi:MAG: hypothetical protein RDV48_30510 [Candidatus Eremiobacteraeota bacterium]|nr:hypothetical protein [Candidatus Eremiobacteraeota bacterium]